jgi:hypothetical protein
MIDTAQQHIATLEKRVGTDGRSPLFAQLAQYYLEASRAQDALRVCDAGLANFPFYTTGHLVKGKALVALHMQAEARREFEFVLDFLPNNETIINLLAQIPLTREETLTAPAEERTPEPTPPSLTGYTSPTAPSPDVPFNPLPSFNFGGMDQVVPEQQPALPAVSSPAPNFFDELIQAPPDENSFGSTAPTIESSDTFKTSPFSEFNFPTPEPLIPSSTESSREYGFTSPGSDTEFSLTSAQPEEETFENFSTRKTTDLTGENTVSMEEYLNSKTPALFQEHAQPSTDSLSPGFMPPGADSMPQTFVPPSPDFSTQEFSLSNNDSMPQEFSSPSPDSFSQEFTLPNTGSQPQESPLPGAESTPPAVPNNIEELTNKLQSAGKITPVINFAQKETPAASEQDTLAGMGFVTPTLAEIYAKQGWFDDAIKAYRTLSRSKPAEKERFEKRISELEELKKKSGG